AKEQAENGNLAEHVVEPIERNERPAQMDVILDVVDVAFRRHADDRPLHGAFAHRNAAMRARKLESQVRKFHARLLACRQSMARRGLATRRDALKGRLAANRKVANVEDTFLHGKRIEPRRIHGQPHLTAEYLLINVGKSEERTGISRLEIEHIAAARP